MRQRHFSSRVCAQNKRTTEILHYVPELYPSSFLWGPKFIAITKSLKNITSPHTSIAYFGK